MPYLEELRKKYLAEVGAFPEKEGDWNYLYTKAYLDFWNQPGNQRYHNIHKIGKSSIFPEEILEVSLVEQRLIHEGISLDDRNIARGCAWQEFYDRIGSFYERLARMRNGDLEEFKIAIKKLEEMTREFLTGVAK